MKSRSFLLCVLLPLWPLHTAAAADVDIVLKKETGRPAQRTARPGRSHVVRSGDTLSGILLSEGLTPAEVEKMLPEVMRLNPGLTDPDSIFPGQELTIPDPSLPPSRRTSGSSPSPSLESLRSRGELVPLLRRTFADMDEQLSDSGFLSLPYGAGGNVTIDNTTFPLLQLSTGKDLILDLDGRMPADWKSRIEDRWPGYEVVGPPRGGGYGDLLDTVLAAGGFHSLLRREAVTFGRAAKVRIVPDFIVIKNAQSLLDGDLYVVTILEDDDDALPPDIRYMAETHSITVIEVLPVPGQTVTAAGTSPPPYRTTRTLTASDIPALLPELLPLLGFPAPEEGTYRFPSRQDPALLIEVFPAARVEWEEKTLLVFFDRPDPAVLDELPDEEVTALVFSPSDSFAVVLGTLLNASGRRYSGPAVEFFRPDDRFSISVRGFYLMVRDRPIFLTAGEMPPRVAAVLADSGISVLSCRIP